MSGRYETLAFDSREPIARNLEQARLEQLGPVEEERDFLVQEKDTLADRLDNLEARQGSLQEQERQAKNRGTFTTRCTLGLQ